jgi:tetratricopeptide (TPR) repeat protein
MKNRNGVKIRFLFVQLFLVVFWNSSQLFAINKVSIDSTNVNREDIQNLINYYIAWSDHYTYNAPDTAFLYADSALLMARNSDNRDLIALSLFNKGNVFFTQGLFERAVHCFYEYLEIQQSISNSNGVAFGLSNIGAIYLKMERFEEAKTNYLQAWELLFKQNKTDLSSEYIRHKINILNNLGIAYQNLEPIDSAFYFYDKSLELCQYIEEGEVYESSILNNIGILLLNHREEYDSAYACFTKSLQIRERNNDNYGLAFSFGLLGDYYRKVDSIQKAQASYHKAYTLSKVSKSHDLLANNSEKLYALYIESGNADSALKYLQIQKAYGDSINSEETVKELTRLRMQNELVQTERINEIQRQKSNLIMTLSGFAIVLLIIALVLLFFNSRNRIKRVNLERDNLSLLNENEKLEKQNLQNSLELKNKELTTNVMSLIRKNEIVKQVKKSLIDNSKGLSKSNEAIISSIIRDLNSIQDESLWDEFEVHYEGVHNEFYSKLYEYCPDLTNNEKRLCAFLRLNMATKEISSITGQSQRSIEVARTRLRKKLKLTNSGTSLSDFLISL